MIHQKTEKNTIYNMTQEEKELLLKDLCARLLYGVKLKRFDGEIVELTPLLFATFAIENFKPYLRPMSSMTEEEEIDMLKNINATAIKPFDKDSFYLSEDEQSKYWDIKDVAKLDWLNTHHFDFRGLIEKGLAVEAPAGMYDIPSQKKRIPIGEHVMYLNEEYVVEDNSDHYILWCVRKYSSVPVVHLKFEDEEYLILKKD